MRRVTPLRLAVTIALVFIAVHVVIELNRFQSGPLSRKGIIRVLDFKSLDLKFLSRTKPVTTDPKVVIAAVDEKSIDRYGLWPWNRRIIADVIDRLTAGGAKVIAFDMVFGDEDRNSSYASVKRFLNAYDERALSPTSQLSKDMVDELRQSIAAQNEMKAAIADVEQKIKNDPTPSKPAIAALTKLKQANERGSKDVNKARELAVDWNERSGKFYDLMQHEVADVSPDEALARAVGRSPQTILGYFFLYSKDETKSACPLKRCARQQRRCSGSLFPRSTSRKTRSSVSSSRRPRPSGITSTPIAQLACAPLASKDRRAR